MKTKLFPALSCVPLVVRKPFVHSNAYAYDHIGNHTTSSVNSDTTTFEANALNQYTSFSNLVQSCNPVHDLDGNMLTNGVWSYTYDAENRLVAAYSNNVCVVSNAYDHMSRRVVKTTQNATHFFIYDGWNLVQETVQTAQSTVTNRFVWGRDLSGTLQGAGGVGGLLAVWMDATWCFPFYDNNGNITAYVGEFGSIVAEYVYDAYGGTIAQSGSMADAFAHRFSTKYYDAETGLYYYGYRFYDPAMHRWLNRDPIEEDGGLNLYAFCGNDIINQIDAFGEKILKLEILHDGAANISDEKYVEYSEPYYVKMIKGDLGGRSQFITGATQRVIDQETSSTGLFTKRVILPPVAAALYKFEYKVERKHEDRQYRTIDYIDGTYKAESAQRFSLKQEIVKSESSVKRRKANSQAAWRKPWRGPKLPVHDGPSLTMDVPSDPVYGQNVLTYGGDALRLNVDPQKGYEYKVSITWIVTARDKCNSWSGKHRITMILSDSDPSAAQFAAEIIEEPKEVKTRRRK
jgi:RHS repeat-associated protein